MDLIKKAAEGLKNAYAPYSRFRVGAAVATKSGQVFMGCNVENASYGATICAERNAIHAAVAAGNQEILKIVVVTEASEPATPCGICRQVIAEFSKPNAEIICATADGKKTRVYTVDDLLPHSFSGNSLKK